MARDVCPAGTYHVVTAEIDANGPLDLTARIDGFTITGGSANVDAGNNGDGGGMFIRQSSPAVVQCTFVDNLAIRGGGLTVAHFESEPIIANAERLSVVA